MRSYETCGATSASIFHLRYSRTIFLSAPKRTRWAFIKERRTIYRSLKSNQTARDKLPSRERNDKSWKDLIRNSPRIFWLYYHRNIVDITKYFSSHDLFSLSSLDKDIHLWSFIDTRVSTCQVSTFPIYWKDQTSISYYKNKESDENQIFHDYKGHYYWKIKKFFNYTIYIRNIILIYKK